MSTASNKDTVQKVNNAFAVNDLETFLDCCTEDISWTMVGKPALQGKEAIREIMKGMENMDPPKVTVHTTIGEGDTVACDGRMSMKNPDGSDYHGAFCDFYLFKEGKIVDMKSYIVDLKEAEH